MPDGTMSDLDEKSKSSKFNYLFFKADWRE